MSATLERPTIYHEALFGEPLGLPVRHRTLDTNRPFWIVGEWFVVLPTTVVRRAPDVQRMISEVRAWTGWSLRQLARVLGTSHTTVLNAEAGRPLLALRSGDLRRRVNEVHDVVERVYLLSERDASTTSHLLATAPRRGQSAVDALRAGRPEKAYLAAIDALRPRPTGMLTGSRPRRSGATAALHD
jgi:transcriptional regulator with XRE-family HTH domain